MRLIDADKLSEKITEWQEQALNKAYTINPISQHEKWEVWSAIFNERTAFMHDIADAPTIDAVYVVRCKDCKYRQENTCDYSAVWTRPNGFCQWGERKDDAPTANPVKHGHWEVLHHFEYRCSQCGEHWNTENGIRIEDLRYCPRCGAKMETEEMMEW